MILLACCVVWKEMNEDGVFIPHWGFDLSRLQSILWIHEWALLHWVIKLRGSPQSRMVKNIIALKIIIHPSSAWKMKQWWLCDGGWWSGPQLHCWLILTRLEKHYSNIMTLSGAFFCKLNIMTCRFDKAVCHIVQLHNEMIFNWITWWSSTGLPLMYIYTATCNRSFLR